MKKGSTEWYRYAGYKISSTYNWLILYQQQILLNNILKEKRFKRLNYEK